MELRGQEYPHADMAVGLGKLDEVRVVVEDGLAVPSAVEHVLPLLDVSEGLVVHDDDLERQMVLQAGRELLGVHLERAVAAYYADLLVGKRNLRADGCGEAVAHGAESAGVEPLAGFVKLEVLRDEHLVLSDIGADDALAAGDVPQLLDDLLGLDVLRILLEREALPAAPAVNHAPPVRVRRAVLLYAELVSRLKELPEDNLAGSDDRDVGPDGLGDRGRIDVDMDNLGVRAELRDVVRDAVSKPRSDGKDDVGVVHGHVGLIGAVHAEHSEEASVSCRERAESHQCAGNRHVEALCDFLDLCGGVRDDGAAADEHYRMLRAGKNLGRALYLPLVAHEGRVVGAHAY